MMVNKVLQVTYVQPFEVMELEHNEPTTMFSQPFEVTELEHKEPTTMFSDASCLYQQ
jgi:hypothetical protein